MIVAMTSLWFYAGSSDKVYIAEVIREGDHYSVRGKWGRRGRTMQSQIKGNYSSETEAMIAWRSLVGSKTSKGYQITGMTR